MIRELARAAVVSVAEVVLMEMVVALAEDEVQVMAAGMEM